mmetsp:Transcript_1601/g.2923  ORF Transcript_1601/g.2923 Transcript_1601/m.2923 type:complete len:104 (+) Transcript_1601:1498-1809(+)
MGGAECAVTGLGSSDTGIVAIILTEYEAAAAVSIESYRKRNQDRIVQDFGYYKLVSDGYRQCFIGRRLYSNKLVRRGKIQSRMFVWRSSLMAASKVWSVFSKN